MGHDWKAVARIHAEVNGFASAKQIRAVADAAVALRVAPINHGRLELAAKEEKGEAITPPGLPSLVTKPAEFFGKDCVTVSLTDARALAFHLV